MASQNRAQRYKVPLRIIYDAGSGGFWTAKVADMAELGLFVETTHTLEPGTEVTIVPDEDEGDLPFEIRAEVVRVQQYDLDAHWDRTPGIAFKLLHVDDEDRERLRTYMAENGTPVE